MAHAATPDKIDAHQPSIPETEPEHKRQRLPLGPLKMVHVFWLAGMSCDGCSIAVTGATNPGIEGLLLGVVPAMPKVLLHHPVLAVESGEAFVKAFKDAADGLLGDPCVLVFEGSVADERIAARTPSGAKRRLVAPRRGMRNARRNAERRNATMTDAELWSAWRLWMGVATVVVFTTATLLVIIWLTAGRIRADAGRALTAAEAIRAQTQPIWGLQVTNEVAEDILATMQAIEAKGGRLAQALEPQATGKRS